MQYSSAIKKGIKLGHLEEYLATHSSSPAWEIPWTEQPDSYSPWGGGGEVITKSRTRLKQLSMQACTVGTRDCRWLKIETVVPSRVNQKGANKDINARMWNLLQRSPGDSWPVVEASAETRTLSCF